MLWSQCSVAIFDNAIAREENTSQKSGASTWTGLPPEIAASMTAAAVAGADAPYYAVACQPEEIAQVALFLASDASSAITGQTILVCRFWFIPSDAC